jgi:hypothetical protein
MELVPIDDLISSKLEIEDFNRLTYHNNMTMHPSMTNIVAMKVQLWSHQGYW